MIHVLSVFGTRPEAIKMAPLIRELERRPAIQSTVCVTAQHREMLDQVLRVFGIVPDYDLNIMRPGQSLSEITTAALIGLEAVLQESRPDLLLVHGDTGTCLSGALAAYYQQIPIGHVEAGLRSYDKYSPFPEEMNRQLTDRLSDLLFAPTALSREQLLQEHIPKERIFVTGNTVVDALCFTVGGDYSHPLLETIKPDQRLVLLTAHRRENLGEPIRSIYRAVRRLAEVFPDLFVLCPLHLNPAVRSAAREILSGCDRVLLTEPPDVVTFHHLLSRASLILTDSGGIQEEAAALNKPVLVLRDTTERPEGVEAGVLRLIGVEEEHVFQEAFNLLHDPDELARMSAAENPFGDGHASERIADIIEAQFSSDAQLCPTYLQNYIRSSGSTACGAL